jgi:hypothetical protein
MVAIACIVVAIGARHMEHAGTTESSKSVGGSSGSNQLSTGGRSTEMISDRGPDANRKVLIKCLGENLLPTAQTWRFGWPGPPVAAPGTGNRHADLFCYFIPGQALVANLKDLLRGGTMCRRTATTHADPGTAQMIADRGLRDAQLGSDLAQSPALGVKVGCTLNVHVVTVVNPGRIMSRPHRSGRHLIVTFANSQQIA